MSCEVFSLEHLRFLEIVPSTSDDRGPFLAPDEDLEQQFDAGRGRWQVHAVHHG